MKIEPDISDLIQGGRTPYKTKHADLEITVNTPSSKKTADNSISKAAANPKNQMRIYDAVSLALMAQNVIQKAITISSRLKNLAQKSIVSGKTDFNAIDSALSEINSSFNEIDTGHTSLFIRTFSENLPEIQFEDSFETVFTDIKKDLDLITRPTVEQQAGKPFFAEIENTLKSLEEKKSNIDNVLFSIRESYLPALADSEEFSPDKISSGIINNTSTQILRNPVTALTVQGNINPEKVVNIFIG